MDPSRNLLTHDLQASPPEVRIGLSRAGVTRVQKAIRLRCGGTEKLIPAEIDCTVDLEPAQKGVHMSRFPELFEEAIDEVVIGESFLVEELAEHIAQHIVERQRARARRGTDRHALPARAADAGDGPADAGAHHARRDRGRERARRAARRRRRGPRHQRMSVRAGARPRTGGGATARSGLRRRRRRADPRARAARDAQPARARHALRRHAAPVNAEQLVESSSVR